MTTLRRFSTAYLQNGRRKVLIPYCPNDNSDLVLTRCVEDNTLIPSDSICLVNVVTPSFLSQWTTYSMSHGVAPISTTMDLVYAQQPDLRRQFLLSNAEDMLERVAHKLRLKDLNVRTVVLEGDIRSSMVNLAQEFKPDIILCTTNKASKIKKLFSTSVSGHLRKNAKKSEVIIINPDDYEREVLTTDHFDVIAEEDFVPSDLATGCTPNTPALETVTPTAQSS
ncbi:hypothetical protein INT43_000429 [Umbelopsis isabellina]|uniref:UspA domain-containing protein n=1 Tax=Mortierella isabellina TaxID=91625 RepID=A0A8H7UIN1_MORIS|nr:hypothetical protein INT43_000429 [Umbelopsis isabellina]